MGLGVAGDSPGENNVTGDGVAAAVAALVGTGATAAVGSGVATAVAAGLEVTAGDGEPEPGAPAFCKADGAGGVMPGLATGAAGLVAPAVATGAAAVVGAATGLAGDVLTGVTAYGEGE